jgi:hypothetical protein
MRNLNVKNSAKQSRLDRALNRAHSTRLQRDNAIRQLENAERLLRVALDITKADPLVIPSIKKEEVSPERARVQLCASRITTLNARLLEAEDTVRQLESGLPPKVPHPGKPTLSMIWPRAKRVTS